MATVSFDRRRQGLPRRHAGARRTSTSRSPTASSWSSSARPAAARRPRCGWSPASRTSPRARSASATASSTGCTRASRDVAMVFQNYALYPHMTVYENIAFALKVRKTPDGGDQASGSRRRRGSSASPPELKRKPAQLSGGQRQRVAMGRAIVRDPQVFLMDEPLSNLDAKLRVQMRAEIARIQRELGATTIYVTHDQVEAMTMGDRVAVLRKGAAPAGRRAADALRPPGQPVRGQLHRQPGDEPRRGAARARRATASSAASASRGSPLPADAGSRALPALDGLRRPDDRPRHPARAPRGRGARRRRAGGEHASRQGRDDRAARLRAARPRRDRGGARSSPRRCARSLEDVDRSRVVDLESEARARRTVVRSAASGSASGRARRSGGRDAVSTRGRLHFFDLETEAAIGARRIASGRIRHRRLRDWRTDGRRRRRPAAGARACPSTRRGSTSACSGTGRRTATRCRSRPASPPRRCTPPSSGWRPRGSCTRCARARRRSTSASPRTSSSTASATSSTSRSTTSRRRCRRWPRSSRRRRCSPSSGLDAIRENTRYIVADAAQGDLHLGLGRTTSTHLRDALDGRARAGGPHLRDALRRGAARRPAPGSSTATSRSSPTGSTAHADASSPTARRRSIAHIPRRGAGERRPHAQPGAGADRAGVPAPRHRPPARPARHRLRRVGSLVAGRSRPADDHPRDSVRPRRSRNGRSAR